MNYSTPLDSQLTRYTVKVRAESVKRRTYLFGSENVSEAIDAFVVLIVRVDPDGERVTIVMTPRGGGEAEVCELDRGEVYAIKVEHVLSVAAYGTKDSRVYCSLYLS